MKQVVRDDPLLEMGRGIADLPKPFDKVAERRAGHAE
jgi:hypothetical protein